MQSRILSSATVLSTLLIALACSNGPSEGGSGAGGSLGFGSGGTAVIPGANGAGGNGAGGNGAGGNGAGGTELGAGGVGSGVSGSGAGGVPPAAGAGGGFASGGAGAAPGAMGGSGGTAAGSAGSGGAGDGSGGSGSGGDGAGGSGPASGGSAGVEPVECLGVRIVGRHGDCEASGVRMGWSGTGFVARFEGTGLRVTMAHEGSSVQYTVVIDGAESENVAPTAGAATYSLAESLESAEHTVEFYRRGEGSFGPGTLQALEVIDGALLPPLPPPARYIEIVGDSVSCGYGNEGSSSSCSFSADTENHYWAYGAILGRAFGADVSTVAWSGKGVVVNYDGDTGITMPELYERSVADDESTTWGFSPQADLVIVNLGTNDYSTDNDPTDGDFIGIYTTLLETIRSHYPGAYILGTVGPLLSDTDLESARSNIQAAVQARVDAGDGNVASYEMTTGNPSPGCDYHPSLATHQAMADELATPISLALGW